MHNSYTVRMVSRFQDGYICSGGFRPVVDGDILPDTPDSIRASGEYNKVPEMIGINENEASIFVGRQLPGFATFLML